MLIWIMIIALLGVFGIAGFFKGGVRMTVSYFGLFLATILTVPLSIPAIPLAEKIGVVHPIGKFLTAGLIVFAIFNLVFVITGYIVHHFWVVKLRYKRNESQMMGWRQLNRGVGLFIGVLTGVTYTFALGLLIYISGNFSKPFASEGKDPGWLNFLNGARADMQSTGLARTAAAFDIVPNGVYKAMDKLALMYKNPDLSERIPLYPAFLALTATVQKSTEHGDLAGYGSLWKQQASVAEFISREDFPLFMVGIGFWMAQLDLDDFDTYLRTGDSARYSDQKIVGQWKVDASAVMKQVKRSKPGISIDELIMHKKLATTILSGINITATPDNEVLVVNKPTEFGKQFAAQQAEKIAEVASSAQVDATQIDQQFNDRYGLNPAGQAPPQQRGQRGPRQGGQNNRGNGGPGPGGPEGEGGMNFRFSGGGSWKEDGASLTGSKYKLSIPVEGGNKLSMDAEIRQGKLRIYSQGLTLVLNKIVY
jgi:hypothetical protein